LLQALILGEKNSLDSQSKEQFIALGVMHVFVVSGFHFTLLSGLLWQILGAKWLPFKRLAPNYKRLIMLSALFGYLLLLGPANYSALRAFIVLALTIITLQLGHPLPLIQRVLTVLVAAVIIEPAVLQSVGFQMSFGAWALLALLSPLLQKGKPKVAGSLDAMLAAELTTAVWGTMLLMPLSLNLFGSWPFWAILFGPLLAICLSHTQKMLYISATMIWTVQALNITPIVTSVFFALAMPIETILTWLKELTLPDISIISGSNISIVLTCGYCSYLIFYLVKIYGPISSEKILARYSL
jgi:ComEC/Rec2-related protein